MTSLMPNLGLHTRAALSLLTRRSVQTALALAALTVLLSIVLAPDTSPSTSEWVRIILIGGCGSLALLAFAASQSRRADGIEISQRLVLAGILVAVALAINLTFSLGSTILLSLGFTIAAAITASSSEHLDSWKATGVILALIPFWVWSALDAWTWLLLVLIPLAGLAIQADGHIRATTEEVIDTSPQLSAKGHRLACWLGVLGGAVLTLGIALVTEAADGVNALGALGAVVLIGLEAVSPLRSGTRSRRSVLVIDVALLWLALCWIESL